MPLRLEITLPPQIALDLDPKKVRAVLRSAGSEIAGHDIGGYRGRRFCVLSAGPRFASRMATPSPRRVRQLIDRAVRIAMMRERLICASSVVSAFP